MRRVLLGLAATLMAGNAFAADYLRGSTYEGPAPAPFTWSGFYIGGQVGRTDANGRFGSTARPASDPLRPPIETASQLANWVELPDGNNASTSYGGFFGYNAQWGEVVLGLEANYNHGGMDVRSSSQVLSTPAPGALIDYTGRARMTDYGTLRARAGYAWDFVLPYVFTGIAIGRGDYTRTATTSYPTPPDLIPTYTDSETRKGTVSVGYAVGAGVDIALMSGLFVRGEYEFVHFTTANGVGLQLSTFRAGAGYKF